MLQKIFGMLSNAKIEVFAFAILQWICFTQKNF